MGRYVSRWFCRPDWRPSGRALEIGCSGQIGTTWTVIGVVIVIGIGIMFAVSHSGSKENIQIDRE